MEIKVVATKDEREDAYYVRMKVFVEEQKVDVEEEIDQYEEEATHIVVYDEGKPVGAGRLRVVDGYGKMERICVMLSHRKAGVGKLIMSKMESLAVDKGLSKLKLHGQTHAEGFYEKLGYVTVSGEFMDAGIPHVEMVKKL